MNIRSLLPQNFARLAAVCAVLGAPSYVHAAAQTWNDAGPSNLWSTTAPNWLGDVAWTDGNNAVFNGAGETVEVDGTVSVTGIGGTPSVPGITLSGDYTIADVDANGVLDISGAGGSSGKPIISHVGSNTISANIRLSGISNNERRNISGTSGATLVISGNISESDEAKGLNIGGASSTVTLSGSNTFSAGVSISNNGTRLNVGSTHALGTGALNLGAPSANLGNASGGALTLATNNEVTFTSSLAGSASAHNLTYDGANDLNMGNGAIFFGGAQLARSIRVTDAGALILNGEITENNAGTSFFKNGDGTLELGGVGAYTGDTTVSAGTLLLSASSESRFVIQNGDESNQFLGSGTVSFDGVFRLDITGLTDAEGTWSLVNIATLSESFGSNFGLAFLGGPSFTAMGDGTYASGGWTFDTGTGELSLVPEPATSILALGGLGVMLLRRRRSRRA